jgi:hypothetical protein
VSFFVKWILAYMPYQDELLEGAVVSLWVGDLESEDAVMEYLGQSFERDFGFLLDDDDPPEIAGSLGEPRRSRRASTARLQKLEIRELLEALSCSHGWIDEAEQGCHEQGLDAARIIIAFHHLSYRPALCRNPQAPVRFIGTFAWPGGRGNWEEKLKAQVISPPFPTLRGRAFGDGDLFAWGGRVRLDAWKGFAKREELADEFMWFRFSARPEGDLGLDVSPLDNHKSTFKPTHAQARAFQHLLDNQKDIRHAVLEGIFSVYGEWRENYYGGKISSDGGKTYQSGWELPKMFPPENMPKLANPDDLVRLISPATVYVLAKETDGFTRIGFGFDCKWDQEHDLGVLTHKGRVVEVGQADTAFTDK